MLPQVCMIPRLVAVATDANIKPAKHPVITDPELPPSPHTRQLTFGQDVTSATGRSMPFSYSVGPDEATLKPKMEKLLDEFAHKDPSDKAQKLFDEFLKKQTSVKFFKNDSLNRATAAHTNIQFFCSAAVSAPNSPHKSAPGKTRIYQALKQANWDITKMVIPTDLGVPALNLGSAYWQNRDFANGLAVMINGVQHVYVVATYYHHDAAAKKYHLTLKYYFYDVFGLDDDDLDEYGVKQSDWFKTDAAIGITAWWQLQHQHGYTPLVTRFVVEQKHEMPT